ncbi:MAG: ATP-binding cassette domain-containing protein [Bacteroidales bacterium]|nr:ATP-binding cassette domain-containing protein [Bacteroidales bacterium]
MSTAIEFNNVSKQYRLGLVSTKTLSHDLNRWWQTAVLHKEDPYLKIGSVNDRSKAADSEYVWALKDIDFKVEQGDVVGIIGKNGAGKSTLLKILSRVTGPTTGTIKARGRIGSLLEVGTGFHPEMTGRENIYLNGAILGMSKQEISRKLDEIVDFSGCERYIDTPVKRYSSGMMVRLGFAVAAHLDPEILVVDEVLAVGDAEFQKKAIGKMQDVSKGEGRTVLFVSHNMTSIKALCKRGVILSNGILIDDGPIDNIVSHYLRGNNEVDNYKCWQKPEIGRDGFELLEIGIMRKGADFASAMRMDQELELMMRYRLKRTIDKFWITLHMKNEQGNRIFSFSGGGRCYDRYHEAGEYFQTCVIPANFLNWGNYAIDFMALQGSGNDSDLADEQDIISFVVTNKQIEIGGYMGKEPGDITPQFEFFEEKVK